MSAFDDWLEQYKLRSDWRTLTEEEDVENAFNAGLEAAAQEAENAKRGYGSERHDESCTYIAKAIRALKD